ncbi:hypothetical protein ACF3DV_12155 [Chlorogloeopsis fritschii PCC 9212]|uniref:IPT/TIG domain-containing protein n=1 Tax=Chlorogloeopsis fritschii PCC 6912 TaxID=211165 RepID=A0A3S1AB59_CHLFR|nr:hypothetical protein [Chlorogloeopsis fritschii]RUR74499.1 hypothetical protein PCC6912_52740 [Chlorogloeopsis fritschii PCC 6912]
MKHHHGLGNELCECSAIERPRYFPRQMITADDMILEQTYFRDKLRRHNRLLHGWGTICGAIVCPVCNSKEEMKPWLVNVSPGYILGPYGDEIVIDRDCTIDICTTGVMGMCQEPSPPPLDPWCSDVKEIVINRCQGPVYIAVKYKEIMARPVRLQPMGCGCDDMQCEYSRWCDGYEIGVLTELPESHRPDLSDNSSDQPKQMEIPKCPPCPSEPWVVLAEVDFDPNNGDITKIDNYKYRRILRTHTQDWLSLPSPEIKKVTPDTLRQGDSEVILTVEGNNLRTPKIISFGKGIKVTNLGKLNELNGEERSFQVKVSVDAQAQPENYYNMTIIDVDCNVMVESKVVKITASNNS